MKLILTLVATIGLVCNSFSQYQAITNVYLINSNGDKPIEKASILIKNNLIEKVGPSRKIKIPEGAVVHDLRGKYVIPGLVDGHIHFFQSGGLYTRPDAIDLDHVYSYEKEQQYINDQLERTFERYLRSGITGVADVGGGMWNFDVRDKAGLSKKAPRVIVAGPLISTIDRPKLDRGDPPIVKVTNNDEVDALVDKLATAKADLIKIWFIAFEELDFEKNLLLVKRTIDRSHAAGIRVAVHATELETARASVIAGADILVHSIDDAVVDDDFIEAIKKAGTIYTPAISVLEGLDRIVSQNLRLNAIDYAVADMTVANSLLDLQHITDDLYPDRLKRWLKDPDAFVEFSKKGIDYAKANVKKLQDAGVTIATGTDAGNPGTWHGTSIFREFQLLSEAGLSPEEILVNTTLNGAKLMGFENQTGSIENGKFADLVVLNQNPLTTLENTADIHAVMKDGKLYPITDLLVPTPEEVVQRQLVAYNQKDLEAFIACYADDVQIFSHPDELILEGKNEMRKRYTERFKSSNLHAQVVNRIVVGNKVIDHENVIGIDESVVNAVATYEVRNGAIKKVWFISE